MLSTLMSTFKIIRLVINYIILLIIDYINYIMYFGEVVN